MTAPAAPMDVRETSAVVQAHFGWKPGLVSRAAIRALEVLMSPLEEGSYEGRPIAGGPHMACWVTASPLNVFVLPRVSWRAKVVLAARLRHSGSINVVESRPKRDGGRASAGGALEALVLLQSRSDVSLRLVPVARTSHQMTPGPPAPGTATRAFSVAPQNLLRRATSVARTFRTGRVKNCSPLVLSKWLACRGGVEPDEQAEALRLELAGNVYSQQRACEGPPVRPAREVKRRVLADPLLASYIGEYALREGMTRDAVLEEAASYIEEIASDFRVGVVRWFARAVDMLFDRFLTGLEVDSEGIRFLSECDSSSRLVLVCSHKSYLDPLLIGYALFRSGMVPPQQAAGLNLNIWPLGWLLRHSAAFYLRRTFAGETLYKEVFSAYVRYLLAENHIIGLYAEGTRSRDGKLAQPKTGFLGILEDAMRMGVCPGVTLVPVYLGYDKVPEEGAHVKEMAGGRKSAESVKGFGRIYRSVNTRLGKAYVKFGRPLDMRELLEREGLNGAALAACNGINEVTPVTARSLAAGALLAGGDDWVADEDTRFRASVLIRYAESRGCPMAADADVGGVMSAVDWFAAEGRIAPEERDGEGGFHIKDDGRRFLEYNKNITLHHFLGASFEGIADRAGNGSREDDLAFLAGLFAGEFVWDPDGGAGSRATSLPAEEMSVVASLVESYLEAYMVAARAAYGIPASGEPRDDVVSRCFSEGESMMRSGSLHRSESLSRPAMFNALRLFAAEGDLEQVRRTDPDGRERVSLAPGPRFSRLPEIEKRLRMLLG